MPVLRLHFTGADLARTHVAGRPDPLWETVLSLRKLQNPTSGRVVFADWQTRAGTALASRTASVLSTVIPPPPVSNFPDFLTPADSSLGLDDGLEAILCTPVRRISHDLVTLGPRARQPLWLHDGTAMLTLTGALRGYHDDVLGPMWPRLEETVQADIALRTHDLRTGGPGRLLAGLPWPLGWEPPVLVADYPVDKDLHLGGRGLLLVPSYFCWRRPVTLIDNDLPPVLVYPVDRSLREPEYPARSAKLAALIGGTRAAVLEALVRERSTSELAELLGIARPTVSDHTKVLREAGLIVSVRRANTMLHMINSAGCALLKAAG